MTDTNQPGPVEPLSAEQARVLGCLIEKQMTTPEYYPMTVNALVAASNQSTNRHPVVTYDVETVERALSGLNDRELARFTRTSGARALKYVHKAGEVLEVDDQQLAVLAILLLRGPQTPGELRARTERYVDLRDVATLEQLLEDLQSRDVPLVRRLERVPGQKESRYSTLLMDADPAPTPVPGATGEEMTADAPSPSLQSRLADVEARLARIESELGLDREQTEQTERTEQTGQAGQ